MLSKSRRQTFTGLRRLIGTPVCRARCGKSNAVDQRTLHYPGERELLGWMHCDATDTLRLRANGDVANDSAASTAQAAGPDCHARCDYFDFACGRVASHRSNFFTRTETGPLRRRQDRCRFPAVAVLHSVRPPGTGAPIVDEPLVATASPSPEHRTRSGRGRVASSLATQFIRTTSTASGRAAPRRNTAMAATRTAGSTSSRSTSELPNPTFRPVRGCGVSPVYVLALPRCFRAAAAARA